MEQDKLACEKKITRLQQTVETMKQSLKHSEKQEVSTQRIRVMKESTQITWS